MTTTIDTAARIESPADLASLQAQLALAAEGRAREAVRRGGRIPVDLADGSGLTTYQRVFQFDLALPPDAEIPVVGERVYARFDRPAEPVAQRLWRSWRRLFLDEFGV